MADHHASALDVLLAALKDTTPKAPLADVVATPPETPAGANAHVAIVPQPATFTPTLALSRHRELLTQFIAATAVDLASNHEAAALLMSLHTMASDIDTYIGNACEDLYSACEGLELFVSLMSQNDRFSVDGSQVRGLLQPLMRQFDRATSAVGKLL
ncbi:DUF1484 family protein [Bordetella avium]|uniref:DUF1484 family protein n=1 Tax=Bordetella avium TaxID=521 RepID=UPI0015FFFFC9|nr:DUF1484 family protein [Bordetella avium]